MIRFGGPVLNAPADPVELAKAHRTAGYRAAYVPDGLSPKDAPRMREFERAFQQEGVMLAECNGWRNLLASDPAERKKNLDYVCLRLAVADEVGARCCVDFLGTFAPGSSYGPHPDNLTPAAFELAVQTVRTVIDAVKPRRAKFALEMMQWILPDSVDSYVKLIQAIDRPAFGVHLDPVNLIVSPRMYYDTGAVIRECFEKLGRHVVSCHAKDLILRDKLALHLDEVPPGHGNMDYRTYLSALARLPNDTPLMLEHLSTAAEYVAALEHLKGLAGELKLNV
jgi:sugar phosphate isomerase/epimerase